MNLVHTDSYFPAALQVKQNALNKAIKLAIELDDWAKTLQHQERQRKCLAAIEAFKKAIEMANQSGTYVSTLIFAKQSLFQVINNIDPDVLKKQKIALEQALELQNQEELQYANDRYNMGLGATFLGLIADVSVIVLSGYYGIMGLFIPSLIIGLPVGIFLIAGMACCLNAHIDQSDRCIVSDQIAIPLASLEEQLYPPRRNNNALHANVDAQPEVVNMPVDVGVLTIAQPVEAVTSNLISNSLFKVASAEAVSADVLSSEAANHVTASAPEMGEDESGLNQSFPH